jgi:predicted membrane protein
VLTAAPFVVGREMTATTHGALALALTGMSAGFAHGLGLRPTTTLWRLALSPWTAWPLMLLGWLALLVHRS